jgi:hypothetical protein
MLDPCPDGRLHSSTVGTQQKDFTMRLLAACLFALSVGPAVGAKPLPLIEKLRADLIEARALPAGEKTSYRCPEHLDQLQGIKLETIKSQLPRSDFHTVDSVVYFLTSPVPADQRGGGFPQIEFVAGESGVVEKAVCSYAR